MFFFFDKASKNYLERENKYILMAKREAVYFVNVPNATDVST